MLQLRCLLTWLAMSLRGLTLPTDRLFLEAVYKVFLEREPDPEGLGHYLLILKRKPGGYWRVMRAVRESPEFASLGAAMSRRGSTPPTDRLFLEAIYKVFLEREPDAEALEHYLPILERNPDGYWQVMRAVRESPEFASLGAAPRPPVPLMNRAGTRNPACQTAALEFITTHFRNQKRYANDDEYVTSHARRFAMTLALSAGYLPPASRVLDVGSSYHMPILMWKLLGVRSLRACGFSEEFVGFGHGVIADADEPNLELRLVIDKCHIEEERWPYDSASFDVLTCSEVLEHLRQHPLFMMAEANRVLATGGYLIITTPNSSSYRAILQILQQGSPYLFARYNTDRAGMEHIKEYSVAEMQLLYGASGFEVVEHTTFNPYADDPTEADPAFLEMLKRHGLVAEMSGSTHFIVGRKIGPPQFEYLEPIYTATRRSEHVAPGAGGAAP